ncbi:MAG: fructose-1,6-bisphosphatase [Rikenellaceae bacterium]
MDDITKEQQFDQSELRYLTLLAKRFPTIMSASSEIINLEAIINLPKGTEYFLTDLHGEHEAFGHVMRNASGVIRQKVYDIFGNTLRESEMKELCTLIYYPEKKIELVKLKEAELGDWYRITLNQLCDILRSVTSKYTRSKVQKSLPKDFSYIIQELLNESTTQMPNKHDYLGGILTSVVVNGCADRFIIEMCNVIQRFTMDHLHIVGDIFDRGAGSHHIMDMLEKHHNFDVQWGNHDILWMGAASGNLACIANVLRISLRYANIDVIEDGYGINLLPLATFAMECYGDKNCDNFIPKFNAGTPYPAKTIKLMAQMHKAITIIQIKLESEIIARRAEFDMADRDILSKIDYVKGMVNIDGVDYMLNDLDLPTIDPSSPNKLSDEERDLMTKLAISFSNSDKLHRHVRCLFTHGSIYLAMNNNLIYHASIPLNQDGSLKALCVGDDHMYSGKKLLDKIDRVVKRAYFGHSSDWKSQFAHDYIWYLWCGKDSPLFGKDRMRTFERYFISDKESHKEVKGNYYRMIDNVSVCKSILSNFGLPPEMSHIINGHVPVKLTKGETPIKAGGKLLVIDGGFSKAYQPETGIAGFTLIFNSYGMHLVQHEPFESTQKAIEEGVDIISTRVVVELISNRVKVKDTNVGRDLSRQISDLRELLFAYRSGQIKEFGAR